MIALITLGSFAIAVDGAALAALPRKEQAMLAVLARRPGHPVSREILADLLWGLSGPEQSRHSLRQALTHLRRTLGADAAAIVTAGDGIQIDPALLASDVASFAAAAHTADRAGLAAAAALYRGEFLAGFATLGTPFDDWLGEQRRELATLAADIFIRLVRLLLAANEPAEAVATAQRLVALDPLRDDAQRLLMEAYAAAGRRNDALRQYAGFAGLVARELDATPDPETAALAASLSRLEAAEAPPVPPPIAVRRFAPIALPAEPQDAPPVVAPAAASSALARFWRGRTAAALLTLAVMLPLLARTTADPARAVPGGPVLMVRPLLDQSGGLDNRDIAAAVTDDLAVELGRRSGARVMPRGRTDAARAAHRDPAALWREDGVRYIVDGAVTLHGATARLDLTLLDAKAGQLLWSSRDEGSLTDLPRLARVFAGRMSRTLDPQVGPAPRADDGGDAARAAGLARLGWFIMKCSCNGLDAFREAQNLFEAAVRLDPGNVDALVGSAQARTVRTLEGETVPGALDRADRELRTALAIEPRTLSIGHGRCMLLRARRLYDQAEEACREVLDRNPAFEASLQQLWQILLEAGRPAEAADAFRKAVSTLPRDRAHDYLQEGIGQALLLAGRNQDAAEALERAIAAGDERPEAQGLLAAAYERLGRHEEAAAATRQFRQQHPELGAKKLVAAGLSQPERQVEPVLADLRRLGLPE